MHNKIIDRLTEYIQLEKSLRDATNANGLGFIVCNQLKQLINYDAAVLCSTERRRHKVQAVSGVSDYDKNAPLVLLCESLASTVAQGTNINTPANVSAGIREQMHDCQINQLTSVTLDRTGSTLFLIREAEWQQPELQLLSQSIDVADHALAALNTNQRRFSLASILPGMHPDWRWAVCLVSLLAFLPVSQSIVANAEVSARTPTVIAAGLNGVIKEVLVKPNQAVTKGQVLVKFDDADLAHRQSTLKQELALAVERLRKSRQNALNGASNTNEFAELNTQISLKQLELEHIEETIDRLTLRADSNGIALFSRQQDWAGRAVSTGEKIMEIAASDDTQFEIWLNVNDAIELNSGSGVKFFPDAKPLESVTGSVNTVGYYATPTEDGALAYRVVAEPEDTQTLRLGMKGTARLYGNKVLLGYHLLRKPISVIRQSIGV